MSSTTAGRWPRIDSIFGSPYRLWAGVAFGAAVATKWSGAFGLLFAAALCSVWAFTGDRRADRTVLRTAGNVVASFVVVPLGVYLVSYGSFFFQHGPAIHDFITLQVRMLRYQQHHVRFQPENSRPWTWPLLLDPIRYFRAGAANAVHHDHRAGQPRALVGVPDPAAGWALHHRPAANLARCAHLRWVPGDVSPVARCAAEPVPLLHAPGCPVHVSRRRRGPAWTSPSSGGHSRGRAHRDHNGRRGAVPARLDGLVNVRELAQPLTALTAMATIGRTKGRPKAVPSARRSE